MDRRVADWLVSAWPDSAGRDIAVLYDYRNLSIPAWLGEVMAEARAVDLVAWSLGVWAAVNSELEKSTVPWRSTARQRHSMRSEAFRRRFSQARSKLERRQPQALRTPDDGRRAAEDCRCHTFRSHLCRPAGGVAVAWRSRRQISGGIHRVVEILESADRWPRPHLFSREPAPRVERAGVRVAKSPQCPTSRSPTSPAGELFT